jgi:hypothetical protein
MWAVCGAWALVWQYYTGPELTRRKAQADADARLIALQGKAGDEHVKGHIERIKAENKAELMALGTELEYRTETRIREVESRRQRNIEAIVQKAVDHAQDNPATEPVTDDWIAEFFNCGQDCCDADIQLLWAKILAGEVSRPGTVSRKTLAIVRTLGKPEAELFRAICSYVWTISYQQRLILLPTGAVSRAELARPQLIVPGVVEASRPEPAIFENAELNYDDLVHLEHLGLITHAPIATAANNQWLMLYFGLYFGRAFYSQFKGRAGIELGDADLTQSGRELSHFVNAEPNQAHLDKTLTWYRTKKNLACKEVKAT